MRSDDDQWGITESVGVTALGVASGRAMETRRRDGLVDDPYAEAFVEAAAHEIPLPTRPVGAAGAGDGADGGGNDGGGNDGRGADGRGADGTEDATDDWERQSAYVGVRSRFFDDFFADAAAGVDQVVLLAAGLDTRAQRLAWPEGTTVFEVDQAEVLDFKDDVLAREGGVEAGGGATRVIVRVDLRHDWPAALRAAGFDPDRPCAWLAEGLLPYLPAQAEADLFDRVHRLSAPGSRLAVEHFGDAVRRFGHTAAAASLSRRFGMDVGALFYDEPREDAAERLRAYGWTVEADSAATLAERYGRDLNPEMSELYAASRLLDARRAA